MKSEKFPGIFAEIENKREHIIKIFWSAFYFACSYILVTYSCYVVQAANALYLNYDVILSYNGVKISGGDSPWNLKRIAFVFLASPLSGLFFSLLGSLSHANISIKHTHLKLFFFWLCINGFAVFYSYIFTGLLSFGHFSSPYFTGFAAFLSWQYLKQETVMLLLLIFGILVSFYTLTFGVKTFTQSYSGMLLETQKGRIVVLLNILIIPFIVGLALVVAITYPMDFNYLIIRMLCYPLIFTGIFVWVQFNPHVSCFIKKGGMQYRSYLILIILTAALSALAKFILPLQIHF